MTEQKEGTSIDLVVLATGFAIANQIVSKIIEYNDPNLQAKTEAQVRAHMESFKNTAPLPEHIDQGVADNIVGQFDEWLQSIKK